MLEFLESWVEDIVVLLVMTLVIEMAVPRGAIKRYVDYAIGLMLLLLLLAPLSALMDNEASISSMLAAAEQDAGRRFEQVSPLSAESTWLTYRKILESNIAGLTEKHLNVVEAQAEVTLDKEQESPTFGKPVAVVLRLRLRDAVSPGSKEEMELREDVTLSLIETYSINPSRLTIELIR